MRKAGFILFSSSLALQLVVLIILISKTFSQ